MRAAVSRRILSQAQSCRSYFCQETARFLGVPLPGKKPADRESAEVGMELAFAYASSLSNGAQVLWKLIIFLETNSNFARK